MPFKSEIKRGFKWVLRTYTLSPHFVSTLCRIRFVSTLCPYALSKAEEGASSVSRTSLHGTETRCEDKVCHRAAKGQRSAFTLKIASHCVVAITAYCLLPTAPQGSGSTGPRHPAPQGRRIKFLDKLRPSREEQAFCPGSSGFRSIRLSGVPSPALAGRKPARFGAEDTASPRRSRTVALCILPDGGPRGLGEPRTHEARRGQHPRTRRTQARNAPMPEARGLEPRLSGGSARGRQLTTAGDG